ICFSSSDLSISSSGNFAIGIASAPRRLPWPVANALARPLASLSRCCLAGGLHSSVRLLNQRLEGGRIVDGEVGQNLTVDCDAGLVQPVDELAVRCAELAGSGIDALDPKCPEIALAALAIAIGILLRPLDRLLGNADRILAPAVVALGSL